jgi:hypothetical protein
MFSASFDIGPNLLSFLMQACTIAIAALAYQKSKDASKQLNSNGGTTAFDKLSKTLSNHDTKLDELSRAVTALQTQGTSNNV